MSKPEKLPDDYGATVAGNLAAVRSPSSSGDTSAGATLPATPVPIDSKSGVTRPTPPTLEPGSVVGGRYQIIELLGEGGMGAVYKAQDLELDRTVALKTILPQMASNAAMLARFKQEVALASQITHRNVVRLYDLGESDGLKFITMEFIEGQDLRSVLQQHGKFSPPEAVGIVRQVCLALEAAHNQGVVHRDLKPQNIMRERRPAVSEDRIVVMDFGLARTLQSSGMTQTGALVGTMEYMSPEQALGEEVDTRSDLFALGLICYELLSGQAPYKADSAIASLLRRTQERAAPVSDIDATVPPALSNIVAKCLERDRNARYQSAQELLRDLDLWQAPGAAKSVGVPIARPRWRRKHTYIVSGLILAIALAGVVTAFRHRLFEWSQTNPAVTGRVASLAILPFQNATGNASLDWVGSSIADTLSSGVGESTQLHVVSADRVDQVLRDLRISSNGSFDDPTLHKVAEFSGADQLVSGRVISLNGQIRLDATLRDLKRNRSVTLSSTVSDPNQLLTAVQALARSLQESLSLSAGALRELRAVAFIPSTNSVDALREYTNGLEFERQGNHLQAEQRFLESVKSDPNFALAFSKLAQTYAELGYDDQARQASRKAVDLSESLPGREKNLIQASHWRILGDIGKAIQQYESLAKESPEDDSLQFTLGQLYQQTGAPDKAREHYKTVLQHDPKSVDALLGMGEVETLRANPQDSVEYLNRALALTIQFGNDERRAKVLQDIAVAYRELSKPDDALRFAEESLDIRRRLGQKKGIAQDLHTIAQIQANQGKMELALKGYQDAIRIQREIGDNTGLGDTLVDLGNLYADQSDNDKAVAAYKESLQIERNIGNKNFEAANFNNIALIYVSQGRYDDAQSYYEQALHLREQLNMPNDMADTLHNLGDVATLTGQDDRAVAYYTRALDIRRSSGDRRGAAMDSQSIAVAFEQQGRFGAALKSTQEAVKTFRDDLQERGYWLAEVLGGYGNALNLAGRTDESEKPLNQALALGHELNNPDIEAEMLNYQGDRFFYTGNFPAAQKLYEQAVRTASHKGPDPHLVMLSKMNLAKATLKITATPAAIANLKQLEQQADSAGLQYLAVDASIYVGEAMLSNPATRSQGRKQLLGALDQTDKLGFRALGARIHYLLASDMKKAGETAEATRHMEAARRTLDDIRKETGDSILKRADLAPIAKS
jgi:tetratricopeptide (TPR) repeat protein